MNRQKERSLLMIKPDGMEKDLVLYIRELILQQGLAIEKEKLFNFDRRLAEFFYVEYKERDYFPALIDFITSRPLMVFLVCGQDAVVKIRRIIGKRHPASGIRKIYAESIIRNVAHGPDSLEAAKREIQLIFGKEVQSR